MICIRSRTAAGRTACLVALILTMSLPAARPAAAASRAEELVEESRFSIERLLADPNFFQLKGFVEKARGVLIIPELVKGGFIVGGEAGSGVLMVRGADGTWSAPAFYTLAAGSFGFQAGGQVSEVVFTLMNDGAVRALLSHEVKLGADAGVAVGPFGAGGEASTTTNLDRDIYAFSKSVGLFGGGALEGAKLINRQDWNDEYYGTRAPPQAIVIERKFFNAHAEPLRNALP
ncbi:MAG: lipid-binding SYLF domain-containing protein [Kiloniellaceae bacterium]